MNSSDQPTVAVVTGAAGGIGRVVVERLRLRFDIVVAADLGRPDIDAEDVVGVGCDVSSRTQVDALIDHAASLGNVRAVVPAAGVIDIAPLEEIDDERWQRVLDVNLTGAMRVCRAAIPVMISGGSIVTVSSIGGHTASLVSSAAYVASKAGVIGLTKALAAQLGSRGIRVNSVAPGVIETPMIEDFSAAQRARAIERTPLARLGTPDDVARTVEFLATPDSHFITGQVIDVNGGQFIP